MKNKYQISIILQQFTTNYIPIKKLQQIVIYIQTKWHNIQQINTKYDKLKDNNNVINYDKL